MSPPEPMTGARFSAVMVVRNEERHIQACLSHLAWCHERIVVDMESGDRTRELARELATAVLPHPWVPHMEFARNRGIDAATGDWILVVDADERIPDRLAKRLQECVAQPGPVVGVWLPRLNHCFGRPLPHIGTFPDYQLRCFRRGAGRYPDRLHSSPDLDGPTTRLPIEDGAWIVHDRPELTIGDLVGKWDVYAEKEARARLVTGPPARPLDLLWAPLSAFRFRFFTMRGYRDGTPGLVLSALFAFYRFEVEAKLWELSGRPTAWDRDVERLRSVPRTLVALAGHVGRRVWRRARGRREEAP